MDPSHGADRIQPVYYGGLPDATPLIDHPEKMREIWDADGVLYFRQVVDPEAIAAVRDTYVQRLQELGTVADGDAQPIWTGRKAVDGKLATKIADQVWKGLVHHPSFDRPIRQFLGEAPSWVPIVVHRASPPTIWSEGEDLYQGRHQDGVFNFGISFITCWVPLMDIDASIGGLAVVPGSHKRSYYDYGDALPTRAGPIPPGKITNDQWRRPDYKVGDILMFHGMMAHSGLPNVSDRFRLSIDVRFVPGAEEKPIVGVVDAFDGTTIGLTRVAGDHRRFVIGDNTVVRGPKGNRIFGEEMSTILFPGADVIAMLDGEGHAKLVRSVSRKYIDLPAAWFTELPPGWVS